MLAAQALRAYRDDTRDEVGEPTIENEVGALLEADNMSNLRDIRKWLGGATDG